MSRGADGPDWERVDEVFTRALDLEPDERAAFLDEACGEDETLRRAVEELLATDAEAEGSAFLGRPAAVTWEPLWEGAAREATGSGGGDAVDRVGERLGPWRLEEVIGRGGMATVYRARRADGEFEQEVAVKLVRPGLAADWLLRRLRAEREILSGLSHPNIARLLDGGTTGSGLPYLVVELVEGRTITAFCEEEGLGLEGRLELFLEVLEAVGHAHRKLVLHRDLKPSNIMVAEGGRVRLLDFGIAKLLDPDALAAEATLTRPGAMPLTPDYASPEQIRGQALTTASDVYQLGVLLYRLLAGRPPYRMGAVTAPGLVKAVEELDIAPPSEAAAEPDGLGRARARRLRGDLDTIVMKALERDPERRYPSAGALAEDLRRHLAGLPIAARPPSPMYRLRKFLGRHRWLAPAAAVLLLAAGGYGWTLHRHALEMEEQRDVARAEAARAEQVRDFLVLVFGGSDSGRSPGDTVTARELLARGAAHADSALAGQPGLRAEMLGLIGRISTDLGFYDRARPLLERALDLTEELHGADAPEVVEPVRQLALLRRKERDFAAALSLYRRTVRLMRGREAIDTARLAGTLDALAAVLRDLDRPDSAETVLHRAMALVAARQGRESEEYFSLLGTLAYVLRAEGEYDRAEGVYRTLLDRQGRAAGPNGGADPVTLNNLAYLLTRRGEHAEAASLYRDAAELLEEELGADHPTTQMVRGNLTSVLVKQGRLDEAVALARRDVRLLEERYPDGHWRVGAARERLGKLLLVEDEPDSALAALGSAIDEYESVLGPDHPWTLGARAWVAAARLAGGRAGAAARLERIRRELADLPEEDRANPGVSGTLASLADELERRGRTEEARAFRALVPE